MLVEREAAQRVLTYYCYFYDGHEIGALLGLFDDECRVTNPRGVYVGKDAVRALYSYSMDVPSRRLHFLTNVATWFDRSIEEARVTAYFLAIGGIDAPLGGTYLALLRRRKGRWRIGEMDLTGEVGMDGDRGAARHQRVPEPSLEGSPQAWIGRSRDWCTDDAGS